MTPAARKIKYDQELTSSTSASTTNKVEESDSEKPGVVLDFDSKGSIVAIEILKASKKMPQPTKFEYEIA